jgi:DNA repair ATPase RecN
MAKNSSQKPSRPTDAASYAYARFWRCALQVNPAPYSEKYRGSKHGLTEEAYNQGILEKCREFDIKVVGIADHGSVDSINGLRSTLQPYGIVVFPGFEIASTEKVHMVCLFPEATTTEQLNRYLGKLDLTNVDDGVQPSGLGCVDLAKHIHDLGGFWYAAHATGKNGLLRLDQSGGGLGHVWRDHGCVRVAQIPGPLSDLPDNYRQIVENKNVDYQRERAITVINAKDVAKPDDLSAPGATCWVKMTEPTFDAFKVAFLDPESRIRLNNDVSTSRHSRFVAINIQGGYLDGVHAMFSEHLNSVIGGRGTGKSTLIECMRYALDLSPKGKQAIKLHLDIIKENLGKASGTIEVELASSAQHGKRFTISRRYGEPPIVRDESKKVSQLKPRDLLPSTEFYGQNEIFELAQDPQSRLQLLDRFLPSDTESVRETEQLNKRLQDNEQRLLKALDGQDELLEQVAQLPKLTEQLKGFESLGIEAKLTKAALFAREKQLTTRIGQQVDEVDESLLALKGALPDLELLGGKALEGLPNAALLAPMRQSLELLRVQFEQRLAELTQTLAETRASLLEQSATWKHSLEAGEAELEVAVGALPDMAGKSGREVGTAYKQLTQEIERIKPLDVKLAALAEQRATLEQERAELLAELSESRSARTAALRKAVGTLNKALKGKLKVELKIDGNRTRLKTFLTDCKLDGVGEKRLAWVDEQDGLSPLALARAIRDGESQLIALYGLTPVVATALAKLPRTKVLQLEALPLDNFVELELNVAHDEKEQYRPLNRLSTGQQCTAVLHMLLLANPDPLVVDQPEDNLDNAFIAERIVRELRDAKTKRQFLFSTHNANIPVFGDAEWIGIFSAGENHGSLAPGQQGSIDVPHIRTQVADILEGGRAAFMQRKEKYDF